MTKKSSVKMSKMKKIVLFTIISWLFVTSIPTAGLSQDGIKFETGSWKEVLKKAQSENRLVFVDVFTEWCGPCKLMVKDIFPRKSVGDFFNTNFINYKIDAEKGEGPEIAKKYVVKGFPTYLFVNGDGLLFYSSMGSMPEEKFLKEAANALSEFKDTLPFSVMKSQLEANKGNRDFLIKYLQKCQVRGINSADAADYLYSLLSQNEILNKETLDLLLNNKALNSDGPLFDFLFANRESVAKVSGHKNTDGVNRILAGFASADVDRAVQKRDEAFVNKIISCLIVLNPYKINSEWISSETLMRYYTETGESAKLTLVLKKYSKSVLEGDKKLITYADSVNYAYRLRNIAQAVLKVNDDKELLNDALKWTDIAHKYSNNFTINEVKAGILFKLGNIDEAINCQKESISAFESIKINNEPIKNRLQEQLSKFQKSKGVLISGVTEGIPDQQVFLELVGVNVENEIIETTELVNGKFSFKVNLNNSPSLLELKFKNKRLKLQNKELAMSTGKGNILAENGYDISIKISATLPIDTSVNVFANIETTNQSPVYKRVLSLKDELFTKFDTPSDVVMKKLQGLNIDWTKKPREEDFSEEVRNKLAQYRGESRAISESKRDFIVSYSRDNKDDILSLFCLFELGKSPYPFARAEEMWSSLFNGLSEEVKSSHPGQIYKAILDKKENNSKMAQSVSIGKTFKDFILTEVNGKEVKLSSCLKKGEYLLLDFWASWCGPCRAENPNVLRIYNRFYGKGFNVVAVSLDESKDAWMNAIKKDNMPWLQLSDLKGWKSEVVAAYGVTGIPASFLIDDTGKIIATNLRDEALEKRLEELLK